MKRSDEDRDQESFDLTRPMVTDASHDDFSAVEVIIVLLKRRRLLAGIIVVAISVVVAWSLSQERLYIASGRLVPISASQGSGVSGIAAQFGLRMPSGAAASSPQFLGDLLHSRVVLDSVARDHYPILGREGETQTITLYELLTDGSHLTDEQRNAVLRTLRSRIMVSVDRETGVVAFEVLAQSPDWAEAIGSRLLAVVNNFNIEMKQKQAEAEQRFVRERLSEARERLLSAERELQSFLVENRAFASSPELSFQHDRLAREVSTRQSIYLSLAQALEESRIDAVRNTPVITVLEHPEGSARPHPRGTLQRALIAAFLSGLAGIALAFGLEFNARLHVDEQRRFQELNRVREEALSDVYAAFRWIKSIFRR